MRQIFLENIVKNLLLLGVLIFLYPKIGQYFSTTELVNDKALAGNVLVAISILAVIACFGAFAFTYETVNKKSLFARYLAHITTGLLMFIIGISLEMSAYLAEFLIGKFWILNLSWLGLYIATIGYDFWDLQRVGIK